MKNRLCRLGFVVAAILGLSPAYAQGSSRLAVGPDAGGYLCPDGRQLYVKSCYDETQAASCGVVNMHLPLNGKYQVETSDTRTSLLTSLKACKIYPVVFHDGVVSLKLPANLAQARQAQAKAGQAGSDTVVLPGSDGRAVALARLPAGKDTSIVYYVDEASRKRDAGAAIARIWTVWVYPKGRADFPGTTAHWVEYAIDCTTGSFDVGVMIKLDRAGKPLGASNANLKGQKLQNGAVTVSNVFAGVACQSGGSLVGPRLPSAAAAIDDALGAAPAIAPKTPAKGSAKAAPGYTSDAVMRLLLDCSKSVGSACTNAGHAYYYGFEKEPADRKKSAQYYGSGCQLNDGEGCFFLALMRRDGDGVAMDAARAKELYKKACQLKSPSCLFGMQNGATEPGPPQPVKP